MLKTIEAVLEDAGEKQQPTDRAVRQWLDDLRDLAYDVDDILDGVATEASIEKRKVRTLIAICCIGLTPT
jgi:hypothetical protein